MNLSTRWHEILCRFNFQTIFIRYLAMFYHCRFCRERGTLWRPPIDQIYYQFHCVSFGGGLWKKRLTTPWHLPTLPACGHSRSSPVYYSTGNCDTFVRFHGMNVPGVRSADGPFTAESCTNHCRGVASCAAAVYNKLSSSCSVINGTSTGYENSATPEEVLIRRSSVNTFYTSGIE